jgi:hypothetical protein
MTTTVSFSATTSNQSFLQGVLRGQKSQHINQALDFYRKFLLKQQMEAGFLAENEENQTMAEWGIEEYEEIVSTAV